MYKYMFVVVSVACSGNLWYGRVLCVFSIIGLPVQAPPAVMLRNILRDETHAREFLKRNVFRYLLMLVSSTEDLVQVFDL